MCLISLADAGLSFSTTKTDFVPSKACKQTACQLPQSVRDHKINSKIHSPFCVTVGIEKVAPEVVIVVVAIIHLHFCLCSL